MVNNQGKSTLPPYVSYRTFRNFIEGLRLGIPSRIDRSYWGDRLSGSNGTQLMTALRFLGLIDNNGIPTTRLRQLVSSDGPQRSEVLKRIGYDTFDFFLDKSINPEVATYAQLEEAFYDKYQVSGDVARKCIKFFISLVSDAGMPLSPFIMKKSKAMRAASGTKKVLKKVPVRTNRNAEIPQAMPEVPGQIKWYEMVLDKFPTFDPGWSDEVQIRWFEAFDALLKKGVAHPREQ